MTNDPLGHLPRYAIFRNRKVRIAGYDKGALKPFLIIDTDDSSRSVSRGELKFLPAKKK